MPIFTFENNTGHTDGPTDLRTYGRTDTTSYRDATAHLKIEKEQSQNGKRADKAKKVKAETEHK